MKTYKTTVQNFSIIYYLIAVQINGKRKGPDTVIHCLHQL